MDNTTKITIRIEDNFSDVDDKSLFDEEEIKKDIVLGKFLNYMKHALYHRRMSYFKKIRKIKNNETKIDESITYDNKMFKLDTCVTSILNNKELYLLNLHYNVGLSYTEISKITNEKVETLKKRRNRAIEKIRENLGE